MTAGAKTKVTTSHFDRNACAIGVVHLGFGAFHRAHQAVYLDAYMEQTGDLDWGIAAVNLRAEEAGQFEAARQDIARHDGYYLKSTSASGVSELQKIRAHVAFEDWSETPERAEAFLARASVHLVTITVTESGYYTDPNGALNIKDPLISSEIEGGPVRSIYGYLRAALRRRMNSTQAPLTIACCDNIRSNGKMLRQNLLAYLHACKDLDLSDWVMEQVAFPCSMVDRITPRSSNALSQEMSALLDQKITSPIMAEDFIQWVLQDHAKAAMPELAKVGVTVTPDVDPYEETKIRVLNGGHTGLTYLAALKGIETFDAAMRDPELLDHFMAFETQEVLPAITIGLPFSKQDYLDRIVERFGNASIGDTVARICADGMAKFPIFIRPTLEGCLSQGIHPIHTIRSIASWHQFCRHVEAGKIRFDYVEPGWAQLKDMLGNETFVMSKQLWDELPDTYPAFTQSLRDEIKEMEQKWPV